jgi:hypothetical protein
VDSPTAKNFSIEKYIEYDASNFLYSLDCSGYLTAALNADIGVSGNAIETSTAGFSIKYGARAHNINQLIR